ncbi:MAG: hypothetical protein JWO08_2176 [Verrucomicrobiaceae bacterium]|nr:hypothetical protein [Verrucomicrobiaceae bacterium]
MAPEPHMILWQSIRLQEYPPTDKFVWTVHNHEVQKGRWVFTPGLPLEETTFENEQGEPIQVSIWCPLEDSPDQPPWPPQFPHANPPSLRLLQSPWRSLYHREYPNPIGPLWLANGSQVQAAYAWWSLPEVTPSEMAFFDPADNVLQGQFWMPREEAEAAPPPPEPELIAQLPRGFVFGNPAGIVLPASMQIE